MVSFCRVGNLESLHRYHQSVQTLVSDTYLVMVSVVMKLLFVFLEKVEERAVRTELGKQAQLGVSADSHVEDDVGVAKCSGQASGFLQSELKD